MQTEILRLLEENGRMTSETIAERLDMKVQDVEEAIKRLEVDNVIKGYKAVIDESAIPENAVKALIEVKVRPEREGGFDRVSKRISKFPEVVSLYLISGQHDLRVEIHGESLQDIADFVASKLATIDGVVSTATHFILKKYKESGKILHDEEEYERLKVSP